MSTGADVNAQVGEYGNALHGAVYTGNRETVRSLLNAGADVNAQGGEYGSALQIAKRRKYYDGEAVIELLLAHGAV